MTIITNSSVIVWLFHPFYLYVFYLIENRFPCKVENCTKEYRTQWELNNHQRQKHITSNINCQLESASSLSAQHKFLSSSAMENANNYYRPNNEPSKERTFEAEQCLKSNNDQNIIYLLTDDEVSDIYFKSFQIKIRIIFNFFKDFRIAFSNQSKPYRGLRSQLCSTE